MDERATRKELVDRALNAAGWRVVSYEHWQAGNRTAADAVEEFPTDSGPGDFLLYLDGQPVADVEAKKLEVGPQNVIKQAKRRPSSEKWRLPGAWLTSWIRQSYRGCFEDSCKHQTHGR